MANTKPEIEFPDGPAPDSLVIEDVIVGDGAEAVPGGNVTVHYVGVEYDEIVVKARGFKFQCAETRRSGWFNPRGSLRS